MFENANNGEWSLVKVVCTDYPEYKGARAVARIVNDRLCLLAQCVDGKSRSYKSTRIVNRSSWASDDAGVCQWLQTRSGKEWVLG